MPSKLNKYMFEEMQSRFEELEDCLVVKYAGLSSTEMTNLRNLVRKENGRVMVIKNSIARKAFEKLGQTDNFLSLLDGPTALAYGDEPAAVVKALTDWNKKLKKLEFKGGILGGRPINAGEVGLLATLPPLQVMRGVALGSVAAPLTSMLGVCNEVMASFLRIVDQLAKQGEAA